MSQAMQIVVEMPDDLPRFRLPPALQSRLNALLDRQDSGERLTEAERSESQELVNLSDFLTLLKLRAERLGRAGVHS